jgi:cyclophilin family peptidyl-prolyl cis-trans isomerase
MAKLRFTGVLLITGACLLGASLGTPGQGEPLVLIVTEYGEIELELHAERAPNTVANFLRYVDSEQYVGGRFHRSVRLDNQLRDDVPIEVIQGGRNPEFRGQGFAVFGRVVRGMDVVRRIHAAPTSEGERLSPPITILRIARLE